MAKQKFKCVFCNKKIEKGIEYCNKCGKDIRFMWKTDIEVEQPTETLPMYCPNSKCHALYNVGELFCLQCGNDYGVNPPIYEKDFYKEEPQSEGTFCPECGMQCNKDDFFCDCGCDFRVRPKVFKKPSIIKNDFRCSICNSNTVLFPGGICDKCSKIEETRDILCPECKKNVVNKFGDICDECMKNKGIKEVGEGFHIPR